MRLTNSAWICYDRVYGKHIRKSSEIVYQTCNQATLRQRFDYLNIMLAARSLPGDSLYLTTSPSCRPLVPSVRRLAWMKKPTANGDWLDAKFSVFVVVVALWRMVFRSDRFDCGTNSTNQQRFVFNKSKRFVGISFGCPTNNGICNYLRDCLEDQQQWIFICENSNRLIALHLNHTWHTLYYKF